MFPVPKSHPLPRESCSIIYIKSSLQNHPMFTYTSRPQESTGPSLHKRGIWSYLKKESVFESVGIGSIPQWQTPCDGFSEEKVCGGGRQFQNYRVHLRPCFHFDVSKYAQYILPLGLDLLFVRGQVFNFKASSVCPILLAGPPRL